MTIREEAHKMKLASPEMAASSIDTRNAALHAISEALQENTDEIFAANAKDMAAADDNGVAPAVRKRLKFDEGKLHDVLAGIDQLIGLEDPVGKTLMARQLDEGLDLYRVSVPIGVIGVIFEARPDALVQIASLCIKSGNCAILKGGRETANTNRVLFQIISRAAVASGLPEGCLFQAEAHSEIDELLKCDGDVDLLIPRGSNAFVRYIMDHTKIPVMGHADGICHIYVDAAADQEKAIPIILDAKLQYTAACNAVETLLINRRIAPEFLPKLARRLAEEGVALRGNAEVMEILSPIADELQQLADVHAGKPDKQELTQLDSEADYHREYLAPVAAVKIVANVKEAADHINRYGSHHTDTILTEDQEAAEYFMRMVDSAGVYQNCSTRFADGFRYGFGAEVGISTSKIHARGPVGLEGLVTYKYRLYGHGQIVGDYASGRKQFHFRDLELH